MRTLTTIVAAVLVTGAAFAQSPRAVDFPIVRGQVDFVLPSSNIQCIYTQAGGTPIYTPAGGGPELSCDRREPAYVNVTLGRTGLPKRTNDPGEQSCCGSANTLGYDQTWAAGPFSCSSSTAGLTCQRSDGRGFSLSRAKIELF